MLLDELVRTSAAVAASPGRSAKTAEIARLLAAAPPAEVPVAVAFLSGELTQRQIGVGYAALLDLLGPDASAGPAALAAPVSEPTLTLADTDRAFAAIGALSGHGSQAQRRQLLGRLLARATASERDFLFRLLAGDLGQGALEGLVAEAVARAAGVPAEAVRRAHQLGGSLPGVAGLVLSAGPGQAGAALSSFTLRVGRPVRPMLAASAASIRAALERICPAAVEWKVDGIRIQVHRQGGQVRVFTRTLEDITARVPEIARVALALPVAAAVLDGEAVALSPGGRPLPFQVTSARAASQGGGISHSSERTPLTPFLFDLLHLDGTDLIDVPAGERYRRLAAIAPPDLVIPRIVTADPAEAEEFFGSAVAGGHEGVVVKSLDARYGAGRRGSEWIKVKPRHTLDLVVLAAEWGHGRRRGLLSNLHLGARDPDSGGFIMLGKTFKGLTDEMLAWQTARLLSLADPARPPGEADRSEARGIVRVRPELVAEIAFDGVQESRRYPGGVALRFARVLRYRPDKDAAGADTIGAVRAIWAGDSTGAAS